MKKVAIVILIVVLLIALYSFIQRKNNNPKIFYFKGKQNPRFTAITIPPIGVFLNENAFGAINPKEQTEIHETVHWKQFQKLGLPVFYWKYLTEYIKNKAYRDNPFEQEAFIVAKQYNKVNPNVTPTNYSGLLT